MRRSGGFHKGRKQTPGRSLRGGLVHEYNTRGVSDDVRQSGEVLLPIGRIRRHDKTVHVIRRRLGIAEGRHKCQQQPVASFLRFCMSRQS